MMDWGIIPHRKGKVVMLSQAKLQANGEQQSDVLRMFEKRAWYDKNYH